MKRTSWDIRPGGSRDLLPFLADNGLVPSRAKKNCEVRVFLDGALLSTSYSSIGVEGLAI